MYLHIEFVNDPENFENIADGERYLAVIENLKTN